MQVIATKSVHIMILELMNLLHGNKLSPEDFFVNIFGFDVISPNQLCKCTWCFHGSETRRCGRYLNSACAVAVVCFEGCKVRGYPAESRTLPEGCCVSGDILRPDNSVAYT